MAPYRRITGLIPAVFAPLHNDGSVNPNQVGPIVEQLLQEKVEGLYVCGSTGEGPSLSTAERKIMAEAHIEAAAGRVPVMIQVGHNSLVEAQTLAAHAQQAGAAAISATPPSYFKPASLEVLLQCLAQIAQAAPDLPLYYYHIPSMTGVATDVVELLERGSQQIPNLAGIKYSVPTVYELQACIGLQDGRFNVLFGVDEMLLSGLVIGIDGAVGTTYNFAAPLFNRIIVAFEQGDLAAARRYQGLAVKMIRLGIKWGGLPAFKAMMQLIGLDCGPTRLPIAPLTTGQVSALEKELGAIGFFEWGRQ